MKWWLIAWREIRWEVFLDRASLLRTAIFVLVPMLLIFSNRSIGPGGAGDIAIIGLALQSVLFPSLGGVALIAATLDSTWGLAAGGVRAWFATSPRRLRLVGGTGGLTMVGLGIGLAATGPSAHP